MKKKSNAFNEPQADVQTADALKFEVWRNQLTTCNTRQHFKIKNVISPLERLHAA